MNVQEEAARLMLWMMHQTTTPSLDETPDAYAYPGAAGVRSPRAVIEDLLASAGIMVEAHAAPRSWQAILLEELGAKDAKAATIEAARHCPICNQTLGGGDVLRMTWYPPRQWWVIEHDRDGKNICGQADMHHDMAPALAAWGAGAGDDEKDARIERLESYLREIEKQPSPADEVRALAAEALAEED